MRYYFGKKKLLSLAMIAFLTNSHLTASNNENIEEVRQSSCFLIKEDDYFHIQEGDFDTQNPPACSFNIALSLMGFQEEKLINEEEPLWLYKEEYKPTRSVLKQDHNPALWMKNSCVWYSQLLANVLGKDTIEHYLSRFSYGNQDLSSYIAEDQTLPRFWISSSLKISPSQQLQFLENMFNLSLSTVSVEARNLTRSILYIQDLAPGWALYGKTGAGNKLNSNGTQNEHHKYGWFVGWLEKNDIKIFFVRYLEDNRPGSDYPSPTAREQVKEQLIKIIEDKQRNDQI